MLTLLFILITNFSICYLMFEIVYFSFTLSVLQFNVLHYKKKCIDRILFYFPQMVFSLQRCNTYILVVFATTQISNLRKQVLYIIMYLQSACIQIYSENQIKGIRHNL